MVTEDYDWSNTTWGVNRATMPEFPVSVTISGTNPEFAWDMASDHKVTHGQEHPMYLHKETKHIFEVEQVSVGKSMTETAKWVGARVYETTGLRVPTLEGVEVAFVGDWVVRDEDGIVYVYTDEDFKNEFEPRLP